MNNEEAKKIFGQNLRKIRISKRMSQDELARKLGYVSRSSINKIEVGRSDMPRSKIELAAKILGVSPLDLFKNAPIEDEIIDTIIDDQITILAESYEKLNDANRMRLSAYIQALIDSQEE